MGFRTQSAEFLGKVSTALAWRTGEVHADWETLCIYGNLSSLTVMLESCACHWGKGDGHDFFNVSWLVA